MPYHFQDAGNKSCRQIASSLSVLLIGKIAVNSAFDSGRIHTPSWKQVNEFPISPFITEEFVAEWPASHNQYCDEWWIFDQIVPPDFSVHSFCNFIGMSISDYKQLDWADGCPLEYYLQRFCPVVVFGNNERGYIISSEA